MKQQYDNPMRRNVFSLPELCRQQCGKLEQASRLLLSTPEIYDITRVILTGCGDSFAAGKAMQYAFQTLAGVPAETVEAVDLARHLQGETLARRQGTTLVIAVSNSGGVTRVGEAIERAGRRGFLTLGITGKPDSLLAQKAQRVMPLEIPPFEAGNGVRSYLVAMLSLAIVAIRMGEVKGRYPMAQAGGYREEILGAAEGLAGALEAIDQRVLALAQAHKDKIMFNFVGAGPDYAAAWFGHAKIVEATGDFAHVTDTEGWMHLDCFFRRAEEMLTVVHCTGDSPSLSRSAEVTGGHGDMELPLCVVGDGKPFGVPQENTVPLPAVPQGWMAPLFNFVPGALLAGYLCEMKGEAYGRGCTGRWKVCGTTDLLTGGRYEVK